MDKVYWINEGFLGGRKGPNQAPWNLLEFKNAGISLIISVTERMMNRSHEFLAYGIHHYCIPLPKNAPPLAGDAENCKILVPFIAEFIESSLKKGQRVIVHCSSGKDRTPLVFLYYLVRFKNYGVSDAFTFLQSKIPGLLTAEGWYELAWKLLGYWFPGQC
jgi:protein-tyrosine phosphatase